MALTNLMVERLKLEKKTTQFLMVSNIVEKCFTNPKTFRYRKIILNISKWTIQRLFLLNLLSRDLARLTTILIGVE